VRKIFESTLVSLDGVIGDAQLWAMHYFGKEAEEDALERLLASDALLMGKHTYQIFAKAWPSQTGDFADRINHIQKYVFSSTLENAAWNNSTIIRGDVAAEVTKLKQQDGRNLAIYGHGPLGQTLFEHNLLDELRFSIHPLFVGTGTLLFRGGEKRLLKHIATKTFETGVVALTYRPVGN
jgi:dihydrofolate reductase